MFAYHLDSLSASEVLLIAVILSVYPSACVNVSVLLISLHIEDHPLQVQTKYKSRGYHELEPAPI